MLSHLRALPLRQHAGDLTHALFTGEGYSQQMEEEWKAYRDIVTETKVAEGRPWLDIRGNHGQGLTHSVGPVL